MNYRHIFHAGNICDVVKHATYTLLIKYLREKDKGFFVLDTHAGTGLYDCHDPRAQKTNEARQGIYRLLAAPALPELADYYSVLRGLNSIGRGDHSETSESFRFYPGSPLLAAKLLRQQDRLVACEWHEEDARLLRRQLQDLTNVQVHHRDGYEALGAFCPPLEKRGLVLIDPPYEATDECDRIVRAITVSHARWPQGMFMIWYPIKDRAAVWRFHDALITTGIPRQLCAEFIYEEETRHDRLNGCGIIIINPPWMFEDKLRRLFHALHEALQTAYRGVTTVWLIEEEKKTSDREGGQGTSA